MTPRTRNNGRGRLMAAGPVNTTGFPALPVETLYEITEHLNPLSTCDYICLRTRTMRSLAETCRRLRSIFLALSFESLEAWGNLDRLCRKKDLARELATQLVRQIEIVTIRNSALAQYVKTVTVSLTTYSAATVYPEFFGCLSVLPNLETLQILCLAESWRNNPFHAALGDRIFPTVRTLLVPQKAFDIIAHYPNIERLTIVDGYILSLRSFLPTIAAMPRLQIFDCRPICSSLEMADIIDCLPLLSEIPDIDIFFVDFVRLHIFSIPETKDNHYPGSVEALADDEKPLSHSAPRT
ncbi:hypothetical protein C8J57DRAFT_1396999 [Mycena rebaudengoi]|nr:hypothetical protein C8J57DRAFT_1396999 [Mycena rebaudengoi]